MKQLNLFLFLIFLHSCSFNVIAQPGLIDSSFGINGHTNSFPWAGMVIVQPNDRILIVGGTGINFGLCRFKSNGKVDSSFGNNGRATGNSDPDGKESSGMVLQQDGKIVVSSSGVNADQFVLARYNSNGQLDHSFGTNGLSKTGWGSFIQYPRLAIQSDGKIIAGGRGFISGSTRDIILIRYNTDGSLDNSFGNGGKVNTPLTRPIADCASIKVQPDGKIVVVGLSDTIGSSYHWKYAMARYNTDGTLDNSFGTGGLVEPFSSTYYPEGILYSVLIQPDGKIVAAADYFDPDFAYEGFACIIRFKTHGTIDSSFGVNGLVLEDFDTAFIGSGSSFADLILQPDNKIITVGMLHYNFNDSTCMAMARYNNNGSIDTTFGLNGRVVIYDGGGALWSVALQSTGKIISTTGYVYRFLNDPDLGTVDLSVSDNPLLIYPNPIQSQASLQYTLTQEEKISIELFEMQGKLVQQFITNETRATGKHEEVLHLNELLPAGSYILSIGNGKNSQGVKIVKE